jgi:hypothetical protein
MAQTAGPSTGDLPAEFGNLKGFSSMIASMDDPTRKAAIRGITRKGLQPAMTKEQVIKHYIDILSQILEDHKHFAQLKSLPTKENRALFRQNIAEMRTIKMLLDKKAFPVGTDEKDIEALTERFKLVDDQFSELTAKRSGVWYQMANKQLKPKSEHFDPTKKMESSDSDLETEEEKRINNLIREFRAEFRGIRQKGTDIKAQEADVSRIVQEEEAGIQGVDADQKKIQFYNIMGASGGLDKETAHEKVIEILTKSGKEEYGTGNLKKPINPKIDPQSVKMQKFKETLNIVTARPIAIKNVPHYEHPSQKLKMAIKNFNTM